MDQDPRSILRRVGLVLVVAGALDTAAAVCFPLLGLGYSPNGNIFVLFAGLALLGADLESVATVEWFMSFLLMIYGTAILVHLVFEPWGLLSARFHLAPIHATAIYGTHLAGALITLWACRELAREPVTEARRESGLSVEKPVLAYTLGGLLMAGPMGFAYVKHHGETARFVVAKAAEAQGSGSDYFVDDLDWWSDSVTAQLLAVGEDGVVRLRVECSPRDANRNPTGCAVNAAE